MLTLINLDSCGLNPLLTFAFQSAMLSLSFFLLLITNINIIVGPNFKSKALVCTITIRNYEVFILSTTLNPLLEPLFHNLNISFTITKPQYNSI